MERRGDLSFGFTLTDSATETYRLAPRNESSNLFGGPTQPVPIRTPPAPAPAPDPAPAPVPAALPAIVASPVSGVVGASATTDGKKKRGRPRKYGPDGKLAMPLCPMPISSSVPLTGDFSALKRGRGRSNDMTKKSHKFDTYKLEPEGSSTGGKIAYYVGANFTPHVITVNDGEDVSMKIMLFSQQEPRAVCILSANGTVSNVTLRQPTLSGGTLTYEGRFEILTLSGSFMPTENGGQRGMCGGMSVSLVGQDSRVLGGGLAGLLVAEGPVQVMMGSFLQGHQLEHKPKKHKTEAVVKSSTNLFFGEDLRGVYGGVKPIVSPFNGANSGPPNPTQDGQGKSPTDEDDMSSSGEDSQDHS